MICRLASIALVAVLGCAERVQLAGDDLPGLVAIDVSPAADTLAITLPGSPQAVEYAAVGQFSDGSTRDITALVDWTADTSAPGSFAASTYTSSNAAAGHVTIRATHGELAGTAALTIVITATIVDDAFPPPADLFAPGTPTTVDPMRSPTILYPADATTFPQGLAQILFQYQHGTMTDAYRLSFESDVLHLQVLTGADRWRPDADAWALIEQSHLGASAVFEVDAASSTGPGTIYTGAPETLGFASVDPGGALYFGAGGPNGILRAELATTVAAKLYPPAGDNTMVSGQAVSRDGQTMALAYANNLQTLALATLVPEATTSFPMGTAALSPDGALVVIANMGMLQLRDATTGKGIGSPDGHIALPGQMATHPDWSPDGKALVFVAATMASNMDIKGGSIARLPYLGNGMWGAPQIIVMSTGDPDNNYFPKWSPDGDFIAYVHATGSIKDAPTAELRLVPAGGGAPVPLRRASHRLGLVDDVPNLANTVPAWAPVTAGTAWLAFGSARPYGAVRTMTGGSQIWIAAIDLAHAGAGDPSSAALWLPAQDVSTVNASPVWAPVVATTTQ